MMMHNFGTSGSLPPGVSEYKPYRKTWHRLHRIRAVLRDYLCKNCASNMFNLSIYHYAISSPVVDWSKCMVLLLSCSIPYTQIDISSIHYQLLSEERRLQYQYRSYPSKISRILFIQTVFFVCTKNKSSIMK